VNHRTDDSDARSSEYAILRELTDRLLTQPSKLDRALTELRRMWSGHRNILPETTIVASQSMSANPGEAQFTEPSDSFDIARRNGTERIPICGSEMFEHPLDCPRTGIGHRTSLHELRSL
jgi:hypothetical protein